MKIAWLATGEHPAEIPNSPRVDKFFLTRLASSDARQRILRTTAESPTLSLFVVGGRISASPASQCIPIKAYRLNCPKSPFTVFRFELP